MAPISEEYLELEGKRKEDGSWHPCRVSLRSSDTDFGIVINFENLNEEDIITKREDALMRLRFRSTPLQDGECLHIKEGECVLAVYKAQFRSMLFDAVIEKSYRVKHSNRVFCRCTFEIKWLIPELEEEGTVVPSKSIMKLSSESIDNHPIFSGFLNALGPTGAPSVRSLYEGADSEADPLGILEKQILDISRFADGSNECSTDFLFEVKRVNHGECKQSKLLFTSNFSSHSSPNNFRRSTRSQHKQEVEVELNKDLQEDKPDVCHHKKELEEDKTFLTPKKDLEEDKPFLSPLAARAAFASLIHELPVKEELSVCHTVERENHQNLVLKDSKKYMEVHFFNLTGDHMKSDDSSQDKIPSLSILTQDTDSDMPVEAQGTSSYSSYGGATRRSKPKESPNKGEPVQAYKEKDGGNMNSTVVLNDSKTCKKLSDRAITARLTRSLMHKVPVLSDEFKQCSSSEKIMNPVCTTRATQSGKLPEKNNLGVNQDPGNTDLAQDAHDIHVLSSPVNTTRVTRSSKQIEKSNLRVNQKPESNVQAQAKHGIPEDLVTPNNNGSKKKRLVSSQDQSAKVEQERMKKTRASSSAASTEEGSGASLGDGDITPSEKKKPENKKSLLKKPEQRSSPRLRFVPRIPYSK